MTTFARQRQGTYLMEEDPDLYNPHGTPSRGLRNNTCNYLITKHFLYFLDYGRKQIVPSVIFSTVDIMHFLSYRKMFRPCGPSTISYRMEVHYIPSRKETLGTICIVLTFVDIIEHLTIFKIRSMFCFQNNHILKFIIDN